MLTTIVTTTTLEDLDPELRARATSWEVVGSAGEATDLTEGRPDGSGAGIGARLVGPALHR